LAAKQKIAEILGAVDEDIEKTQEIINGEIELNMKILDIKYWILKII